ncbi:TPA: lactate utilization protein [Candidatus Avigastranaerophilus faecigallinarum]|nr:lactate utilization protein [Candidatus Avigastranaerophilus faecigallinarum]
MVQNVYLMQRNKKVGEKVVLNLKKRFFDAYYVETKEEALKKAISLIPENDTVSWGGSMSVLEIGLIDYVLKGNYNVINRDIAKNTEERMTMLRDALHCDTYLMSTNALSEDGQLINIDCIGNRTAALMFGPKNVIVIAGMNKLALTVQDAIKRARETAAPTNMQRVAGNGLRQTPCFSTGICEDCTSKDSICSNIVITRLCNPPKRIKVILTSESLGF